VLANYNDAPFLRTALTAILAQTDPADEIIVVDDGSIDDSPEVIRRLLAGHPNAQLVRHERNAGQHTAIQRALLAVKSDYVVWAASDDILLPRFIERSRALLAEHPGVGLCFSRLCAWRDGTGIVSEFSERTHGAAFDLGVTAHHLTPQALRATLRKNYVWISGNTVAARRDALMAMGGFPFELRWHADWFSYYAIALRFGVCSIPETLAMMRERHETYSRKGMRDTREQSRVLRAMLDLIKEPANRDLLSAFRAAPSLLSPFGKRMLWANLHRIRHWDIMLPYLAWQARRRISTTIGRIRHQFHRIGGRRILSIIRRVRYRLRRDR
jgi:glycosyltransferase involved in cell wall biosynthesis